MGRCLAHQFRVRHSIIRQKNALKTSFARLLDSPCQWKGIHRQFAAPTSARWLASSPSGLPKQDKNKTANDVIPISEQLKSVPNILTLTRMASTPLLAYWIVNGHHELAMWGCGLAAVSDFLDGYLAKNYNGETILGTYLDPIADKLFINTLAISLCYAGVLPTPLVALWATKDTILLSGTAWVIYQKHQTISIFKASVASEPLKVTPSTIAKVNTTLQFATLGVGIVYPLVEISPVFLDSLCWVTGTTSVLTMLSYAVKKGMGSKT